MSLLSLALLSILRRSVNLKNNSSPVRKTPARVNQVKRINEKWSSTEEQRPGTLEVIQKFSYSPQIQDRSLTPVKTLMHVLKQCIVHGL